MIWNVFYHNTNAGEIEVFNVFNHTRFNDEVNKVLKKAKTVDELDDELYHLAFYYFASKCEYEIVISQWAGRQANMKVDIFMQLCLNWDAFVDYIWRHKKCTIGKQKD